MNQVCQQTHPKDYSTDLVLVGLHSKYCIHYQLIANYFYAYRDGVPIGGGNTLQAASKVYKEMLWAESDE